MKIAISEAKAKLSGLVNAALNGEQILLTKHGKPVAEIKPFAGAKKPGEKLAAIRKIVAKASQKDTTGAPAAEADHFLYDNSGLPS